jgi:hypothetical protein
MNISEIESTFSRELAEYMEEKYGIDIDEVICKAIREVEDAENSSNNGTNSSKNAKI